MFALVIALLATFLLIPSSKAQSYPYNVLASVVFLRSGERTPLIFNNAPPTLTSLGAQQAYNAGSFLRDRYVSSTSSRSGVDKAPLRGLSANSFDPAEVYILAQDTHPTSATAQAFMQGFYPPFLLSGTTAALIDPSSVLANESYVASPLDGYQYAQIHVADDLDAEKMYIAGSSRCPAFRASANYYTKSPEFHDLQYSNQPFYRSVVGGLMPDYVADGSKDYLNAYAMFDYLNYEAMHNASAAAALSQAPNPENVTELDRLRFLADTQQFALLGNMTARNNLTTVPDGLPSGVQGSISTIAGNMLLAKILNQLQLAIETRFRYYKLSVLVGEFQPLLSLFAISGLSDLNSNKFRGIPDFASMAVFELFTYTNTSSPLSINDVWVRFYFRNGTDPHDDQLDLQSYPLFSHGPSETDLRWIDFQAEASTRAMTKVGDWCEACQATSIWCPAFNQSLFAAAAADARDKAASRNALSPAVSGVLGAVIALIVAALIFALAMLVGGVRLHRKKTLAAGGFHGPAKLTPDRDVEVSGGGAAKNGATVAGREAPAQPEVGGSVPGGHERIGSWEMKEPASNLPPDSNRMRFSFEDDGDDDYRRAVDPFADPVKPREI